MVRYRIVALLLATLLVPVTQLAGASASKHRPAHPDSINRPPKDGCERDPGGLIAGTSPQWAYVYGKGKPRLLRGRARDAYPTYTDLFRAHNSYDMNVFFDPAPRYGRFLGTANVDKKQTQDKDELNTMEIEWEQRAYKLFAWPTAGDRFTVEGSWIWDCGHWGPQNFTDPRYFTPGTQPGEEVTGERTEIHPPRMVVVQRKVPSLSRRGDAVADVLISSVGTMAHAIENHAAGRCTKPQDLCSQRVRINDRNYRFSVKAPPKPSGASRIAYRVIDRGSTNAPKPIVKETSSGIRVKVPFKGWHKKKKQRMIFAKTFEVGWNVPIAVEHYRVTFTKFEWMTELDGTQSSQCAPEEPCTGDPQRSEPPDEVNVYVDVAGQWQQLHVPGLLSVAPGDRFDLSTTFDVFVPRNATWRVLGRGRECDQPNMKGCEAPDEAGVNDDAGLFNDTFTGGQGAVDHDGIGTSSACEMSTQTPCFNLFYSVEDLGPAH
ncbi:MAG: hypothetical protein M3290_08950 [Actinomycetota bacterium]|nr:hypothetical protein [Actinomycetota bacterium]